MHNFATAFFSIDTDFCEERLRLTYLGRGVHHGSLEGEVKCHFRTLAVSSYVGPRLATLGYVWLAVNKNILDLRWYLIVVRPLSFIALLPEALELSPSIPRVENPSIPHEAK